MRARRSSCRCPTMEASISVAQLSSRCSLVSGLAPSATSCAPGSPPLGGGWWQEGQGIQGHSRVANLTQPCGLRLGMKRGSSTGVGQAAAPRPYTNSSTPPPLPTQYCLRSRDPTRRSTPMTPHQLSNTSTDRSSGRSASTELFPDCQARAWPLAWSTTTNLYS